MHFLSRGAQSIPQRYNPYQAPREIKIVKINKWFAKVWSMIIRFSTFYFIDLIQDEEDDVLNNNQKEKTRNSSFGKNIAFSCCFVLKYLLANALVV